MIDIGALNQQLVAQDEELRADFDRLLEDETLDGYDLLAEVLAAGLAAIHERQGNQIILMLQSGD